MTDPRQTTALAVTTQDGQPVDVDGTPIGPSLRTSIVTLADAEARHLREQSDASSRARSRARSAFRATWTEAGGAPHAALAMIGQVEALARESPDPSLTDANANALLLMAESGIGSMRGVLGTLRGAQVQAVGAKQLAEAMRDGDAEKTRAAVYALDRGDAMLDRAREADAAIRSQQREARSRAEWEARSVALTITQPQAIEDRSSIGDPDAHAIDVDLTELHEPDPVARAAATVQRLQAKKAAILGGAAFADPRDDEIRIRAQQGPPPGAAKKLAKLVATARGSNPIEDGRDAPRTKLTRAECIARFGCAPDHLADDHPLAVAEAERQHAEAAERWKEFPSFNRTTGHVGEWKPGYRDPEPAPWQQLRALRSMSTEQDDATDDTPNGEEPSP